MTAPIGDQLRVAPDHRLGCAVLACRVNRPRAEAPGSEKGSPRGPVEGLD